jgi:hypothetical protein
MASLYEMFEEIDDEMLFIMDCVSAIREMVEKGQKIECLGSSVTIGGRDLRVPFHTGG